MPTLLIWKGYRFLFYSKEDGEPPHIHILKDRKQAKIWLHDLTVARNTGFAGHELNEIVKRVRAEREGFLEAWDEHFRD